MRITASDISVGAIYAYCTGPSQLPYLLAACEKEGVPVEELRFILVVFSRSNDLEKFVGEVCSQVATKPFFIAHGSGYISGFKNAIRERLLTLCSLATRPLRLLMRRCGFGRSADLTVLWLCRGHKFYSMSILQWVNRIRPDITVEYFDGYCTLVNYSNRPYLRQNPLCYKSTFAPCVGRLLEADRVILPDVESWRQIVAPEHQHKVSTVPIASVRKWFCRVGKAMEEITGDVSQGVSPNVIIVAGKHSEGQRVGLDDEMRYYSDLIRTVQAVLPDAIILVKTHPRISPEKIDAMQSLVRQYDVTVDTRPVLVEYLLECLAKDKVCLIGSPSTALMNVVVFDYGISFCPSFDLLKNYIGPGIANDGTTEFDHELMQRTGVNIFDSMEDMKQQLHRYRAGDA